MIFAIGLAFLVAAAAAFSELLTLFQWKRAGLVSPSSLAYIYANGGLAAALCYVIYNFRPLSLLYELDPASLGVLSAIIYQLTINSKLLTVRTTGGRELAIGPAALKEAVLQYFRQKAEFEAEWKRYELAKDLAVHTSEELRKVLDFLLLHSALIDKTKKRAVSERLEKIKTLEKEEEQQMMLARLIVDLADVELTKNLLRLIGAA